jgi:4-alpha-glucanotransferase
MNYPFADAIVSYVNGGDGKDFIDKILNVLENYPRQTVNVLMNHLGTHDTARILTVLGADSKPETKPERAAYRLSPAELKRGVARLKLATLILFTFPGTPRIYYGDEALMEGWEDPFNRSTYPWGKEDPDLKDHFTRLGNLRKETPALNRGAIRYLYSKGPLLIYAREEGENRYVTVVNASEEPVTLDLPWTLGSAEDLLSGRTITCKNCKLPLALPPKIYQVTR